jgi:hypothetical protein
MAVRLLFRTPFAADVYPLEYLPFRQLVDVAVGYMETQQEIPLYDSKHFEFLDIAAGAEESMHCERELKFCKFLDLPAELRLKAYYHYLHVDPSTGKSPNRGHGGFSEDQDFCVWRMHTSTGVAIFPYSGLLNKR